MTLIALLSSFFFSPALASAPQLECFRSVQEKTSLEKKSAILLCKEADSEAPAICYKKLMDFQMPSIEKNVAIQLCQNANSVAPAECFNEAVRKQNLSHSEALSLCKPRDKLYRTPGSIGKSKPRKSIQRDSER